MSKAHFGLIGLGVMGENLVLNAERNGFSSVVYNRTFSKTEEFYIQETESLEDFKKTTPKDLIYLVKQSSNQEKKHLKNKLKYIFKGLKDSAYQRGY